MFCMRCGKQIDDAAIACPGCGAPTANYQQQAPQFYQAPPVYQQAPPPQAPIIINNKAVANVGRVRRKRSLLFDIFMICITGGLWIIWMILRPKYY